MPAWAYCSTLLLCLWAVRVQANLPEVCRSELASPDPDTSNFIAYTYTVGTPCNLDLQCNATVRGLSQMTWFIEEVKSFCGLTYNHDWIQLYNVRCPRNHILHMYVQNLNVNSVDGFESGCQDGDYVIIRTQTRTFNSSETATYRLCDTIGSADEFNNNGLGRVFYDDENVTIEFCTTNSDRPCRNAGFVIRATCQNPASQFYCDGCVDYESALAWDGPSILPIFDDFERPMLLNIPHKRSVPKFRVDWRMMKKTFEEASAHSNVHKKEPESREKRGGRRRVQFELREGDIVTLMAGVVTVRFANNSQLTFDRVSRIESFNSLVLTRIFSPNTSFPLTGPGRFSLYGGVATVVWTAMKEMFLPTPSAAVLANHIYDYIYRFWVRQYPFIFEEADIPGLPLPLAPAQMPYFAGRRNVSLIPAVFPTRNPAPDMGPYCRQAILSRTAPAIRARVSPLHFRICRFLSYACDLTVRTACQELLKLDPFNRAGRMMMTGAGD